MGFISYKIKERTLKKRRYTVTDEKDHPYATFVRNRISFKKETEMLDEYDNVVYKLSRKTFSFKKEHYINDPNDQPLYRIFRPLGFNKEIYVESMTEPDALYVKGNLWKSEYSFYRDDVKISFVTREIWKLRDTYSVSILPNENHYLILAITVVLDMIRESNKK